MEVDMRLLKNTQAEELDSTLLANELLQELEEPLTKFNEKENFTPKVLDKINRGSFASVRATQKFTEKMIRTMEMENYELEDCSPVLDEGVPQPCIDIPIKSLFEKLSDYVCVALAS